MTTSVVPLPTTSAELLKLRDLKSIRTLNDQVEDVMVVLWDNHDFRKWLDATTDEDAIEGSLSQDNADAANIIRERAREMGLAEVAGKKRATIIRSMNVVLRRYHRSRSERRDMLGGEIVRSNGGE